MASTLHAARASNPSVQHMIRAAFEHHHLPIGALRITVPFDQDAYIFSFPGYSAITITGLELLQATDPQALIDAKVVNMLALPVI